MATTTETSSYFYQLLMRGRLTQSQTLTQGQILLLPAWNSRGLFSGNACWFGLSPKIEGLVKVFFFF
jgi:hypothetical protein